MKTKFSITLEGWDAAVLQEAVAIELGEHPCLGQCESDLIRQRNWLVRWAIRTVCAAIVQNRAMPVPFGVEVINEPEEIRKLRLEYPGAGPTGIGDVDEAGHSRWLSE